MKIFHTTLFFLLFLALQAKAQIDTVELVILKVDFQADTNKLTTGTGKFNSDSSDAYKLDPVGLRHTSNYWQKQVNHLNHYFNTISNQKLNITANIYPKTKDTYTLNKQILDYIRLNQRSDEGKDEFDSNRIAKYMEFVHDVITLGLSETDSPFPQLQPDPAKLRILTIVHAGASKFINGISNSSEAVDTPGDFVDAFVNAPDFKYLKFLPGKEKDTTGIVLQNSFADTLNSLIVLAETASQDSINWGITGALSHYILNEIGLPSTLDYVQGVSNAGQFDVLDEFGYSVLNGFIPVKPMAWHRKYMQWETPLTIKPGSNQEFLLTRSESQCSTSNCASILKIPLNDAEYILLENRQRSTSHDGTFTITNDQDLTFTIRIDSITSDFDSNNVNGIISSVSSYDAGLPGSGVLVWRINENAIEKFIENNLISTYDEKQFENHITGISLIEADQDQTMGLPLSSSFATFGTASDIYPHINTTDKDTIQSISSAHPAFKSSRSGSANFKLTIHLPGNAYQEKSQNQYTGDSIITFEADTFRVSIEWENNWVPNSKWPVSTIPYQIPQGLHFTDSILLYSSLTGFQQLYDYNGSPVFSDSLDTLEVKQQLPTSKLKQDSTTLITTSLFGQHSTTITSTASDSILYSRGLNQKLYYKHLDSITAPYDSLDIPCTIGPLLWNGMIICASSSPTQQLHWQNTNGSITSKNLPSGMVAQSIALMRDSNAIAIIGSHARVAICKIDGSSSCYFVEPKSVSSASRHLISVSDFDQNDTLDAFILAENGSINIINLSSGKWMHSALQFPFGESGTLNDLSPPAISDIDLDGYPDIIYSRNNKVFALNHKLNALEGFPFELPENIIVNPFGNTLFPPGKMNSSPLLLNVNSDENPEILFTTPDGLIYALDFQGSLVNESESIGWPFTAGSFFLKDTLKNLNDTLTNPYVYLHSTVKLGNTYLAANSVKSLYLWQLSADNNSPNRWLTHSGNYERHNYFDASSVKSNSNVNQNIVEKFYIFPNPIKSANAAVMLSLNQDVEKFTLYFYDISGHEIWSKTFRGMEKGENQKIPFGLEIHESGIYTVKNVVHYEDGSGKTYWDRIAILR